MKRRQRPEQAIQRAVFQHLRTRGVPNLFAFHVPNGGYRRPREAAIMKGLGVVAGAPDVIAIHDGNIFAMELKADNGRPTEAQLLALAAIDKAGGYTAMCCGLDQALRVLEAWGLLRGHSQASQNVTGDACQ